jgi:hypothetical protein
MNRASNEALFFYSTKNQPELFTDRGHCKGEAVAPEDVVNDLEGATTKAL